jgi:hypothetical protein
MLFVIPKGLLSAIWLIVIRFVGAKTKSIHLWCFLFSRSSLKQASEALSNKKIPLSRDASCDPEGIQTPNLLIRSQMLYSVKLRDPFIMRTQI